MAKSLVTLRNETLRRLGDTELTVWTASEINNYITEGYKRMAEQTRCFWDIRYLENIPYSGDHTAAWELDYLEGGDVYHKEFQYTYDWEIEYLNNALGPANHSYPWEWENDHVTTEYINAVEKLPSDFYQMERTTNNWTEAEPLMSQTLETNDRVYQTSRGDVTNYLMDKDGLRTLRKYKVPASTADVYTVTGTFGILRDPSDISSEEVIGSWGIPRRIPGEHPIGPYRFGTPRRPYKDGNNFRIEFTRRGREVSNDDDEFEMPDVYVKYIRHYAMWKALGREGAGQDLKLSQHYGERWMLGIQRMMGRKIEVKSNRAGRFGRKSSRGKRPGRPVLPPSYGRRVR